MNLKIRRSHVVALLLLLAVASTPVRPQSAPAAGRPVVLGLDHVPLAVTDLDGASERYRELGFALKPGRPHENGLRNQHVKFADGTEIELISVREARDSLTAEYLRHLAAGDGPAFVGLFAPDLDRLAGRLDAEGRVYRTGDGLLSFPESDKLRYVFFGRRNRSASDRPEHFRHRNGAEALIGVWIAGDDLGPERQLLASLGATLTDRGVHAPGSLTATVAEFPQAEVVFLPGSRQLVPGRHVVGLTVRTRDLEAVQRTLTAGSRSIPPIVETAVGRSLFLRPDVTHGIWLEFRENQDGGSGVNPDRTPMAQEVKLGDLFPGIPEQDATFVLLSGDDGLVTRYNPVRARRRFIPASTYKIPHALIALETGVAPDADFKLPWDEKTRPATGFWTDSWSQDQTLRSALRNSVYWYYQEIARRVGSTRMQFYLDQFDYGNRSMGGGLDQFWLHGDLRISPDEQVEFLRRMYAGELGVSERSTEILKDLLVLEDTEEYRLSGKTGTAGLSPGRALAWLVGYVEVDDRLSFFALNVEGDEVWDRWGLPEERLALVRSILRRLSVIPEPVDPALE